MNDRDCHTCKHENTHHLNEEPCLSCGMKQIAYTNYEPKEESNDYRSCDNCKYEDNDLYEYPCNVCDRNYGNEDKWESINDPVNRPSHYTDGKIEVIDFIEDKKLGFCLGNAIKYIARAGKKNKDKEVEDLKKAKWYIDRRIKELEEIQNG